MGIRRIRSESGMPIEDIKSGDDQVKAVKQLYEFGRKYPTGKKPHDYAAPERTPHHQSPQPDWSSERATYELGRNSPVTPAPDESQCQFADDKTADHVDASGWVRGMGGQSPHPHFDRRVSGVSDHKYRK
jgi:hypothetical protein